MHRRLILVSCLVFSGLAALVYQIIWTRLLGFAFATTTEAIGTVLAVDVAARRALAPLRSSARSAREGIAAENRLRLELQLLPLPLRSARSLLRAED